MDIKEKIASLYQNDSCIIHLQKSKYINVYCDVYQVILIFRLTEIPVLFICLIIKSNWPFLLIKSLNFFFFLNKRSEEKTIISFFMTIEN